MGVWQSRERDLLDGSNWLRTVVEHVERKKNGVSAFEAFTVEPAVGPFRGAEEDGAAGDEDDKYLVIEDSSDDEAKNHHQQQRRKSQAAVFQDEGVRLFRVTATFRDNKGEKHQVFWLVKAACASDGNGEHATDEHGDFRAVDALFHEIKVFTTLLPELRRYLSSGQLHPRARFLLNLSEYIFQERRLEAGRVTRCHLVLEDLSKTKSCFALAHAQDGLQLGHYKVFLGTLAQFHAVSLAWTLRKRKEGDSLVELFPFLKERGEATERNITERERLLALYEKLLRWHGHRHRIPDLKRRVALVQELRKNAKELLKVNNLQADQKNALAGVCLGCLLPSEVMFQYEENSNAQKEKPPPAPLAVCAAVTTCHRVHFGNVLRETAVSMFAMAQPTVRRHYLVYALLNYLHVLSNTLDLLDVNTLSFENASFHQMVTAFYDLVPYAVLKAILFHMARTDPHELEWKMASSGHGADHSKHRRTSRAHNCLPLTKERLEFLFCLTDPVRKSV